MVMIGLLLVALVVVFLVRRRLPGTLAPVLMAGLAVAALISVALSFRSRPPDVVRASSAIPHAGGYGFGRWIAASGGVPEGRLLVVHTAGQESLVDGLRAGLRGSALTVGHTAVVEVPTDPNLPAPPGPNVDELRRLIEANPGHVGVVLFAGLPAARPRQGLGPLPSFAYSPHGEEFAAPWRRDPRVRGILVPGGGAALDVRGDTPQAVFDGHFLILEP